MRIGQGFDAHAFREGGELVLGGVRIPHTHSLAAHSDGDVALHALCDALLGAAALGDLGHHFPDTDPKYAGISSRALLSSVQAMLLEAGFEVLNVDVTLIAQRPKLAPHVPAMRANIAAELAIPPARVSVKATTTEHLGFTGREEGIAALAVALVREGEA
ncbi:MAG: 2-C-methyl-D-erythritol 2,4-cyclodiphosphate synthase [Gammaproteobacteria bacterium]|nr:MAG: 2-C-methyl-D-erythritol 2,4-cyclodiphosphate synthase [Gammaproteobacteria bacterium]